MDTTIVIPAFNAAASISGVIRRIQLAAPSASIIVVDDGSTDNTGDMATHMNARVITHTENRGKGAALRTGFAGALESPADAIIQLDADGQHDPSVLPLFIESHQQGQTDLIIGARDFRTGGMPLPRRMSNTMTSWAISRVCKTHIPDSQSGYRLLARSVVEKIQPNSNAFDFESEYIVLAARAGFRIGSVPIPTVYAGETSTIRPWKDTYRFIKLMGLFWNNRSDRQLQGIGKPA